MEPLLNCEEEVEPVCPHSYEFGGRRNMRIVTTWSVIVKPV